MGSWLERRVVPATGLAAALPVIASTVRGLSAGWTPEGDQAVIATRAYDVFTSLTPLVGPWSSTSNVLDEAVFSPGPLLYWLLAVPARLSVAAAFPVVMCAINVGAVMGAVALARRRGGRALMFVTAAALALMCASLSTEALRDIWAPTAPLMAFTLLFFVCWSLACGEYRLLPLAVVSASFAMQSHLAFLLPCLAMLGVGLTGLIASRMRGSREGANGTRVRGSGAQGDLRSLRKWSAAGLVVAILCWSGPLADQSLAWAGSDRGHGNLINLVEAADSRDQPAGEKAGAYAVVRAIGVPPWWLRAPPQPVDRTFELFERPAIPALVSAFALLGVLVITTLLGIGRRRPEVAAAGALALVSCAALGIVTASFPNTPSTIFSYSYASWWAAPVGMWTWLIAGWSSATLWSLRGRTSKIRTSGVPAGLPLAAVLVVAALAAAAQAPNNEQDLYNATRTVVRELGAALPDPGTARVDGATLQLETAVIHELRRRGATVGADNVSVQFGSGYTRQGRRYDQVVDIRQGIAPPEGARVVARVKVASPSPATFVVSMRPGE